jgi:uncharacterized protein
MAHAKRCNLEHHSGRPVDDTLLSQTAADLHIRPDALRLYLASAETTPPVGVQRSFHTMIKCVGSACNLNCDYCYYLSKQDLLQTRAPRIDMAQIAHLIQQVLDAQDTPDITFTWHGGEPTLLGVDFFRQVVATQKALLPPGRRALNDLQTNGTLIDAEWAAFLAEAEFLVGVSVDGPAALHDAHRPGKQGQPSLAATLQGIGHLRRARVPFSTLTVVNRDSPTRADAIYRFLRDEVGSTVMQFIPCVEPRPFERLAPDELALQELRGPARQLATPWSVTPEGWGDFLVTVWDTWHQHDRGRVKVNVFESMTAVLRGEPALQCTQQPTCGKNIAIEKDGQVFACDHFVYPGHSRGRLSAQRPLREMVFSVDQLRFGLNKFNLLPSCCRRCPYLKLCWGECPRTRWIPTAEAGRPLSYLCTGWQRFYKHALSNRPPPRTSAIDPQPNAFPPPVLG